jgi:hypothetical protein
LTQLFKAQEDFYDIPTSNLSPIQIRAKLAQVAAQVLPGDKLDEFKELLKNKSTPNGGVAVTDDLKYNSMSLMQLKVISYLMPVQSNSRGRMESMSRLR